MLVIDIEIGSYIKVKDSISLTGYFSFLFYLFHSELEESPRRTHLRLQLCAKVSRSYPTGQLSKICQIQSWDKTWNRVLKLKNLPGSYNLIVHVKSQLQTSTDDMGLIQVIQGYYSVGLIQGKSHFEQVQRSLEQLDQSLSSYLNFAHRNLVQAYLCNFLVYCYLRENKFEKAREYGERACMCIQTEQASSWTAHVYYVHGLKYDILAQVMQKSKAMFQNEAIKSFEICMDQLLSDINIDWTQRLWVESHLAHIVLDVPTLLTISHFCGTQVVNDRLKECNICEEDLSKAQGHINNMGNHLVRSTLPHRQDTHERKVICEVFLQVRTTQVNIKLKKTDLARESIERANDRLTSWQNQYQDKEHSRYNRLTGLHQCLLNVIESLERSITTLSIVETMDSDTSSSTVKPTDSDS